MIKLILSAVIAYCFGNISPAMLISRAKGEDIRTKGSGNAGTTNVLRNYGKKAALATLAIDVLKGFIAVKIGGALAGATGAYLAAVCVMVGHIWPALYGFKGGKGVATTFGTLFFVQMWYSCAAVLLAGILWFLVMKAFRYVSLASLVALLAIGAWFAFFGMHPAFIVLAGVLAVLSLWRHRSNVDRLIHGTENKVGRK